MPRRVRRHRPASRRRANSLPIAGRRMVRFNSRRLLTEPCRYPLTDRARPVFPDGRARVLQASSPALGPRFGWPAADPQASAFFDFSRLNDAMNCARLRASRDLSSAWRSISCAAQSPSRASPLAVSRSRRIEGPPPLAGRWPRLRLRPCCRGWPSTAPPRICEGARAGDILGSSSMRELNGAASPRASSSASEHRAD